MVRVRYWRLWVPLLVGGMMVVAFVPGKEFDYSRYWNRPRRHSDAVSRARYLLENRIAVLENRERLIRLAPGMPAVERGPLRVVYPAPVSRRDAEAWADALVADIASVMHVGEPRGRTVVILTSWDSLATFQRGGFRRWGAYGGALEPCLSFVEAGADRLAALRAGDSPMRLGACSFVMALGAPGPAAAEWLSRSRRFDVLSGGDPRALSGEREPVRRFDDWGPTIRDCLDRNATACARLVSLPDERLAYWLLREHGTAGLERFWRGGPTLDAALSAATGDPAVEAARAWAESQFDVEFDRIRASADHTTRAGLTVGLALAVSLMVARRRRLA